MHPQIELALWIAHPVTETLVLAAMLRRKQRQAFPVFFTYLVIQVVGFLILFPIHRWVGYKEYFYCYWACECISLAVGFMVIQEVFLDVFRSYPTLKDLGSVLFKWSGLVMLMAAVVIASASPTSDQGPLLQAVLTLQRCVRLIQCGLVLFLMVFSKYIGVSWKQRSFGIAMGFGAYAIVEQIAFSLRASSYLSEPASNALTMFAYNAAMLVWLRYMWFQGPARQASPSLATSERWDEGLAGLHYPEYPDSLIPMFESMVDRAFSRTEEQLTLPEETETAEVQLGGRRVSRPLAEPAHQGLYSTPLPLKV